MASGADIKNEEAGEDLSDFKDEDSPIPMDEDEYEDTGELELPETPQDAWLVRVPQMLHEEWSTMDDDAEIVLGVLRTYKNSKKSQMILDGQRRKNPDVPLDYNMSFARDDVDSTFIFSEKDLPGYKKKAKGKSSGAERQEMNGTKGNMGVDKFKRYQQFKRAIPKQTTLMAALTKEVQCNPVDTEATRKMMRDATRNAYHGEVEFLSGDPRQYSNIANASSRTGKAVDGFGDVIRGSAPAKPKAQENKAIRLPKNELTYQIFGCFERYNYWSMKALKQELKQPENWLKEVLAGIADLARDGPFTNTYHLKDQSKYMNYDKAAPELEEEVDIDDEDEAGDAGSEHDSKMSDLPE